MRPDGGIEMTKSEAINTLNGVRNVLNTLELKGIDNCFRLWLCARDVKNVMDFLTEAGNDQNNEQADASPAEGQV